MQRRLPWLGQVLPLLPQRRLFFCQLREKKKKSEGKKKEKYTTKLKTEFSWEHHFRVRASSSERERRDHGDSAHFGGSEKVEVSAPSRLQPTST